MTKEERRNIKRIRKNALVELYIALVDDVRAGRFQVATPTYNLGWNDGHNVGRNEQIRRTRRRFCPKCLTEMI